MREEVKALKGTTTTNSTRSSELPSGRNPALIERFFVAPFASLVEGPVCI